MIALLLFAALLSQMETEPLVMEPEAPFPAILSDSIVVGRGVVSMCCDISGDILYAGTAHELLAYSTSDLSLIDSRRFTACISSAMCTSPSEEILFAGICSPTASVAVLTTDFLEELARVPLDETPDALCSPPGGEFVYAACGEDSTVYRFNTSDFTVEDSVPCGGEPTSMCFSPAGEYLYVTLGAPADRILVIETHNASIVHSFSTGCNPVGICISPGGETLYVTVAGDDYLASFDPATGAMVDSVLIGSIPTGIAILPDGRYLYTANGLGYSSTIIRASDLTVVGVTKSGFRGGHVCCSPVGDRVYTSSGQDGNVYVTGY